MWDFICEQNWNLLLIGIGLIFADIIVVAVLWVPCNKLRDLVDRLVDRWVHSGEPATEAHETGTGEFAPDRFVKEYDAWEELPDVFRNGGAGYGE